MAENHDHDLGLANDLQAIVARRAFLRGAAAASAGLMVAGCDWLPWPSRAEAEVTATAADGSVCIADPSETAGPFPADGSNSAHGTLANVLADSGIVRRDMRPNLGPGATLTAAGTQLDLDIKLVGVTPGCKPLAGYAIYLWHCDADGHYSIYDRAETNYLRAVGVTGEDGHVRFTTIVPGCYLGRAPHMHFEVYPDLKRATDYRNRLLTSQLAIPGVICKDVYDNVDAYSASREHFAKTPPLERDGIFADNTPAQIAAQTLSVSGNNDRGYTAEVTIGLKNAA